MWLGRRRGERWIGDRCWSGPRADASHMLAWVSSCGVEVRFLVCVFVCVVSVGVVYVWGGCLMWGIAQLCSSVSTHVRQADQWAQLKACVRGPSCLDRAANGPRVFKSALHSRIFSQACKALATAGGSQPPAVCPRTTPCSPPATSPSSAAPSYSNQLM